MKKLLLGIGIGLVWSAWAHREKIIPAAVEMQLREFSDHLEQIFIGLKVLDGEFTLPGGEVYGHYLDLRQLDLRHVTAMVQYQRGRDVAAGPSSN